MPMIDPEQFGREMGAMVREMLEPLQARIKELEARQPEKGEKGDPGKDADPVEITHKDILVALKGEPDLLREVVADYLKDNPPPAGEKGDPGAPGKDADPVEITHEDIAKALREDPALLHDVVAEHFKQHPVPAGERGEPGKDAQPPSEEQIAKAVTNYLQKHPPEPGKPGKDGAGATGAMIDKNGELILTLSNGELQRCGVVVGNDGAPGKDGRDLTDLEIDLEDERTVVVRAAGETVKRLSVPTMIDRGYYRKGVKAEKGDCYTHDGSLWCAQEDTDEQPGPRKKAWRLVVRKGRDGTTVVKYKDDGSPDPVKLKGKDDETDD